MACHYHGLAKLPDGSTGVRGSSQLRGITGRKRGKESEGICIPSFLTSLLLLVILGHLVNDHTFNSNFLPYMSLTQV